MNELKTYLTRTDITQILLTLSANADSLLLDVTNNKREQLYNVIADSEILIDGKIVNFTRGSY